MKTPHTPSLESIVEQLRALAIDLEQGRLRVGGSLIPVGDPILLKSKQKISEGKAYFTLSVQLPLRSSGEDAPPPRAVRPEPGAAAPGRRKGRPAEGKQLKKEIGMLWKSVSRSLAEANKPVARESRRLLAACEEYRLYAEPEWDADWQACCAALGKALDAAGRQDFDEALRLAEEVNQRTKQCHKLHK
ncbi:MAG: hypothetical protein ACOY3Z_04960 [Thermodesulfobacteriota bacterium]